MKRFLGCILGLILAWSFCTGAVAQQPATKAPEPEDITLPVLELRISDLESDEGIDADTKTAALDIYKQATEEIQRANEYAKQAADFALLTSEGPKLLKAIREELAKPLAEPNLAPPADATLQQLEQALSQANADLQAARQSVTELQTEANHRNERRTTLPDLIAAARRKLVEADDSSTAQPREGEPKVLSDARRTLQSARRQALRHEVDALEAEAASYDARQELLPARRDRAQRRVQEAEKRVSAWQDLVSKRRQAEAAQTAREAQRLSREAARQHPALRHFADETAKRAKARTGATSVAARIDQTQQKLAQVRADLEALNTQSLSIQRRLDASGLNRATGLLLRHQYDALPDETTLWQKTRSTQRAMEDAEYALIELQEERLSAGDIDRVVQKLLAQIPASEVADGKSNLSEVAHELATARRDLLDLLIADATTYFDKLVDLNTAQRELLASVKSHRAYIEERILWVRSISKDRLPRLTDVRDAVAWLIEPSNWQQAATATTSYIESRWHWTVLVTVLLTALWVAGFTCRKRVNKYSDLVSRFRTDAFSHTIKVLLLTGVLAAPASLTLYVLGWLIEQPEGQPSIALAIGAGMHSAAIFLLPIAFTRQILRKNGLAASHFRWPAEAITPICYNLRWFTPAAVSLTLLVTAFDHTDNESVNATLGRLFFTIKLAVLAVFMYRVLRPTGPVLRQFMIENKGGWVYKLRYIWYPLIITAPLAFAALSWMGFYYTALQLEIQLENSLVLALALMVANGIMLRWLFIARRRVAVKDAQRRRKLALSEASTSHGSEESNQQDNGQVNDEEKIDLPAVSGQTRQLIRAAIAITVVIGLYSIWSQTLPALRMLDRIQIWPSVQIVESGHNTHGRATRPEGAAKNLVQSGTNGESMLAPAMQGIAPNIDNRESQTSQPPISITLADIGLFLIVLIGTWIAFRNVPGLVEIVILQRLPLDAGSRYALSTIFRYVIAIVGIFIAFKLLGISWTKVQWLAAALTFGLSFGLQDIFANFASGLIILAERPIRVGDTVTVSGETGSVTRIRMRATTILDWDRKEIVIPNKTFITNDIINWSLSDSVLRIIIPVGVSYESDVEKVETLLMQIADQNPMILREPNPQVLFKSFGESTLDFELRIFISSIDTYFSANHTLHMDITKSFRKAGIEIAFPQRDLHIRSADGLAELSAKYAQSALQNPKPSGEARTEGNSG